MSDELTIDLGDVFLCKTGEALRFHKIAKESGNCYLQVRDLNGSWGNAYLAGRPEKIMLFLEQAEAEKIDTEKFEHLGDEKAPTDEQLV